MSQASIFREQQLGTARSNLWPRQGVLIHAASIPELNDGNVYRTPPGIWWQKRCFLAKLSTPSTNPMTKSTFTGLNEATKSNLIATRNYVEKLERSKFNEIYGKPKQIYGIIENIETSVSRFSGFLCINLPRTNTSCCLSWQIEDCLLSFRWACVDWDVGKLKANQGRKFGDLEATFSFFGTWAGFWVCICSLNCGFLTIPKSPPYLIISLVFSPSTHWTAESAVYDLGLLNLRF